MKTTRREFFKFTAMGAAALAVPLGMVAKAETLQTRKPDVWGPTGLIINDIKTFNGVGWGGAPQIDTMFVSPEPLAQMTIQPAMNTTWLATHNWNPKERRGHNIALADDSLYKHYWDSLQMMQRFQSDTLAQRGIESLHFRGTEVVFDENRSNGSPYMLFVGLEYRQAALSWVHPI